MTHAGSHLDPDAAISQTQPNKHEPDELMWDSEGRGVRQRKECLSRYAITITNNWRRMQMFKRFQTAARLCVSLTITRRPRTAARSPDEKISLWQSVKISGGVLAWPWSLFHIIYWERRPAGQVYDTSSDETWRMKCILHSFSLPAEKSRGSCEAQSAC